MVKIGIGNRKGQAALEYLMTYGWAILAVVVVLAVLWYLGIFTPKAPEMCVFDSPFSCIGGTAYVSNTTLILKIGVQGALVDSASITDIKLNGHSVNLTANCTVSPGAINSLSLDTENTVTCTHGVTGLTPGSSSFRGTITFRYTDKAGNIRTASGRFSGTVQ